MWELFDQSTLCFIQPFLEPTDDNFVYCFSLSIPLQIGRGGISVPNAQLTTISPEGLIIKLKLIVQDEHMRK